MKTINAILVLFIFTFALSCDVEYFENPNQPKTPPTSGLFNQAVDELMTDTRDVWFSGRFTLTTMQYWHQSNYGDEDRYSYRESMIETWEDFYYNLENFRKIIKFNESEEYAGQMRAYGPNQGQIAVARVMMAYTFNMMADTWGPIPYYSYGTDDPDFQALRLGDETEGNRVLEPAYAPQEKIYTDILNELDAAAQTLSGIDDPIFPNADVIYGGNPAKWKKFANSLRLRIALKVREAAPQLGQDHIDDALSSGVFTSNADNAVFHWEANAKNGAPMYTSWNVDNRSDFAVATAFTQLLKGETVNDHNGNAITNNPFSGMGMTDPRIDEYMMLNSEGNYVGMPVAENSAQAATFRWECLPDSTIIHKPDYGAVLMGYPEVKFILSELNGWDETHYKEGVEASMERWGESQGEIDAYVQNLPAPNEETVLTQKYIALYMQPHTSWMEYRRTGYPETLIMPNNDYSVYVPSEDTTYEYNFDPIPASIDQTNDLPYRMPYPQQESTLNQDNYQEASSWLENGDALISRLWWDVD